MNYFSVQASKLLQFWFMTNSSDLQTFNPRGVCIKCMRLCTDGFDDPQLKHSTQDIL